MAATTTQPLRAPKTAHCPTAASGPPASAEFSPDAHDHFVATYHYVRDRNSDGVTALTPAEFRKQVQAIAAAYHVVKIEEFAARHTRERGLALITFDDALRDQWRAAEILDELRLPGVFFAPMRPYAAWHPHAAPQEPDAADRWCAQHLLHALAEHLGWTELERRVEPHLRGVVIDSQAMNRLYHYEIPEKRRLKYALAFALPADRTAQLLREINATVGLQAADWYLAPDQLVALQAAGHDLGGHGFDHVAYNTLTLQQQATDLRRASETLNALCGPRPRAIAWPFGRCTAETEALARECGYILGFTTENRIDAKFVPQELQRRRELDQRTTGRGAVHEP